MTGLLDSESLPTGMPQLLDTLRWLKIMQLHTTCARSYAGKQTCIPVHATHTHAHSYGVSIFSACCPTWMLMQPEEHGKERQRAVKSISPHCGSG